MIYFSETQRCKIWETEDKGSYAVVKIGTSRKDKKTGEYKNSNWSFVKFVGEAYEKIGELEKGSYITIKGGMSLEEYQDKDGNRAWPKNPQMVVFNWEFVENNDDDGSAAKVKADSKKAKKGLDTPPVVEGSDDFPF